MRFFAIALLAAFPAQAHAGTHPEEVERTLAFLEEDWTIGGLEQSYRETCAWWGDRSFLICETTDTTEGAPVRSVSIFGWSAAERHYTYFHYGQDGRSRSETCFADQPAGLVCLGQRKTESGEVRSRSRIGPVDGGALFTAERSVNGADWQETVRLRYVPRR